jgi:hypothetical protein
MNVNAAFTKCYINPLALANGGKNKERMKKRLLGIHLNV